MVQVGSMMLQFEDDNPPLAPPCVPPQEQTNIGNQYKAIMRVLNANNDEIASLCAQHKDKDVAIQFAEAYLRNTEVALQTESQQREKATAMARKRCFRSSRHSVALRATDGALASRADSSG